MINPDETPYCQEMGKGLVLRTAATASDVERVARFNGVIHGESVVGMTRNLFLHHPNTNGRDLIFVEDQRNGDVVSSLCIIPWTWRYEDVQIAAGEMGIVGTLEPYRRHGLIRRQVAYFRQRLAERGCLISHIQGIPYYYRQFGYEYAIPLEGGLRLEFREIPASPAPTFTFRRATIADLPALAQLYDDAACDLAISAQRGDAIWRYLLSHTQGSAGECDDVVIEDGAGAIAGYMRLPLSHFGTELTVNEASRLSYDAALAALNHLKTLAEQRAKPGIRLCLPAHSSLMLVGRQFTNREYSTYAWQIHVPDIAALLRTLTPVLERRIAASVFAGVTSDVDICLFRETITLRFAAGKVVKVLNAGFQERGPVSFPPLQFIPLLLGYRSLDELRCSYPDIGVAPSQRLLIETLFPVVGSFLYTIY
jgi:predicted acetyltransferase